MRKNCFFVLFVILFVVPVFGSGEKENPLFRALQFTAVTSINLDTALTYDALWRHGAREGNPLVAPYIKNVPLTLGIDCAFNIALVWGTSKIYHNGKKWGKPLAYFLVIAVNFIQAYTFYEHWYFRKNLAR
jgi:hypothetical protein